MINGWVVKDKAVTVFPLYLLVNPLFIALVCLTHLFLFNSYPGLPLECPVAARRFILFLMLIFFNILSRCTQAILPISHMIKCTDSQGRGVGSNPARFTMQALLARMATEN